jgi:NADPH:quinone reductase-like Zn-dependent oxidoreductase
MIGPLARAFAAPVLSWFVTQNLVMVLARPSKQDLSVMCELMKTGRVTPVIDKRFSLSEVPEAIRYLEEGHAQGKVVITLPADFPGKISQRCGRKL